VNNLHRVVTWQWNGPASDLPMAGMADVTRARFALNLARKDLRILVGLLTGHADLNRHGNTTGFWLSTPSRGR